MKRANNVRPVGSRAVFKCGYPLWEKIIMAQWAVYYLYCMPIQRISSLAGQVSPSQHSVILLIGKPTSFHCGFPVGDVSDLFPNFTGSLSVQRLSIPPVENPTPGHSFFGTVLQSPSLPVCPSPSRLG